MSSVDRLRSLKCAYEDFRDCILSIPDDLYLSPIHRWSPRDVVAHLVGWNRNMIDACNAILRGEAELGADHGVLHHRGSPATVTRTIESLTGDYRHHRQKILEWLRTKGVLQAE